MENGVSVAGNKDYPSNEDVEVQKLKDLVRKLEKQNEHLRNRTGKLVSSTKSRPVEPQPPDGDKPSVNNNTAIQFNDGIDLLDDDDMFVSNNDDESSWLYQSPAVHTRPKRTNSKSKQWRSPKEWLADEFEHPSTPQLASAKQNILYKLEGRSYSFDSSFTEPSFIQKSFDEQINLVDTYKPEDATDVKVVARMQQDELKKEAAISPRSAYDNKVFESPHIQERKGSIDDEIDRNSSSSGSPLHSHHLPVPSQTMTTAYGLYPSSMCKEEDSPVRRPSTPTRLERHSPSPRSRSPARKPNSGARVLRRSLPHSSRVQTPSKPAPSLTSSSLPLGTPSPTPSATPTHQPPVKSSLIAPTSRLAKLSSRTGIPNSGVASPSGARGSPARNTQPRRSLPRPSQTSLRYTGGTPSKPMYATPEPTPAPAPDIWGDDDEVY